jgi:2,5-furandicarboxylate decarboxylase 1
VVCGLLGNRDVVADAFGIPNEDLPLFMSGAVEQWHKDQNKFPSEVIEKGPANEVVEEDVDLFKLPIPIHAMKDGGRYFDASVMVVKTRRPAFRTYLYDDLW